MVAHMNGQLPINAQLPISQLPQAEDNTKTSQNPLKEVEIELPTISKR